MRRSVLHLSLLVSTCCATIAFAPPSAAAADAEGSVTIDSITCEELGLSSFCTGSAYSALETFEVYADTHPNNPMPSSGDFTYVYTITNDSDSNPLIGSLRVFEAATPVSGTIDAGSINGNGVEPSWVEIQSTVVRWHFETDFIDPGETSESLYIVSPFGPGEITDSMAAVGSSSAIDTRFTTVGPTLAPPATPCTIGFWKNREDRKNGVLKYFENGDYELVKAEAVLVSWVFDTAAELVAALTSKGRRNVEERAEQQLAALLLNIAAGNLFPTNTKCRLFLGNWGTLLDTDGDGVADSNLEAALTLIESNILSGDPILQAEAHELADDINNGVGLIDAWVIE
jgi:hypothetical protein